MAALPARAFPPHRGAGRAEARATGTEDPQPAWYWGRTPTTEREAKQALRSSIISDLAYVHHRETEDPDDFPYRRADAFAVPVILGTLTLFQRARRIGESGNGRWPDEGLIRDGILVGHAVIRYGEFYVGRILLDPDERTRHGGTYAIRSDAGIEHLI